MMDGQEFSEQLKRMGVSPREFADGTGWDRRNVVRWLKTGVPQKLELAVNLAISAHDAAGTLIPIADLVKAAPKSGRLVSRRATLSAYAKSVNEVRVKRLKAVLRGRSIADHDRGMASMAVGQDAWLNVSKPDEFAPKARDG